MAGRATPRDGAHQVSLESGWLGTGVTDASRRPLTRTAMEASRKRRMRRFQLWWLVLSLLRGWQ